MTISDHSTVKSDTNAKKVMPHCIPERTWFGEIRINNQRVKRSLNFLENRITKKGKRYISLQLKLYLGKEKKALNAYIFKKKEIYELASSLRR